MLTTLTSAIVTTESKIARAEKPPEMKQNALGKQALGKTVQKLCRECCRLFWRAPRLKNRNGQAHNFESKESSWGQPPSRKTRAADGILTSRWSCYQSPNHARGKLTS